jgi:hypothetical protein
MKKVIDFKKVEIKHEPKDTRQPYRIYFEDTILAFAKNETEARKLKIEFAEGKR